MTLKPREPGVSTFAQRRPGEGATPSQIPGRTINEGVALGVLWEAIHIGRTLYGKPCTDLRSFFDACDTDGHEAIVNDRLSDAMMRLGVGLTSAQVETLLATIEVDVSGTVDYDELETWMKRRDQKAAKRYASGLVSSSARADPASRAPWGSKAAQGEAGKKEKGGKNASKSVRMPRLPAVSSARGSASSPLLDDDRHEYLKRDMTVMTPLHNPSLYVEPKASQLEAAIIMHEAGYLQKRDVYLEERSAQRAAEHRKDRASRQKLKQKNQQRIIDGERHRKEDIAAKFGLKMTDTPETQEEWAEVEAELEAQVKRRERRRRQKDELREDPESARRKRERAKAKRVGAALLIQSWMRGAYTRRVVVGQLKKLQAERWRKEALRERKRLDVCDAVVEKLVTDLERMESMEKVALMNQLQKLVDQQSELDMQYDAFLDPTETAEKKEKAKQLAEEAKYAQRWAKLQQKRDDKDRRVEEEKQRAIERAQTNLPAIFGWDGDEETHRLKRAAVEWSKLGMGKQEAALRLGFHPINWPELEDNAIAAAPGLNRKLGYEEWHPESWQRVEKKLCLGSVAGILGLTARNWTKLTRCKPVPKPVHRIGEPAPEKVDVAVSTGKQESEAIRLYKLAVYFTAKHEAILAAGMTEQTPTSVERLYDRLCVSMMPFLRAGMPASLALMLRDGLMTIGWAGGETSEPKVAPEPGQFSMEES